MKLDETIQSDKEIMKLQHDVAELIEKCELDMYIAKEIESIYGILDYPCRLISADKLVTKNKAGEIKLKIPAIQKVYRSKNIILDSGGHHDWVNNKIMLDVANELKPNFIVPKDFPGKDKETVKSVKNFFEIKDSYLKYEPESILIPLQTPYRIHPDFMKKSDYFAIGGVNYLSGAKRERVIETVLRRYPNKVFHLFGVAPMALPDLIKRNKNVRSVDFAIANKVIFSGLIAMGTYSRLPERLYYLYFILNELVTFYNYESPSMKQRGMADFFDKQEAPIIDTMNLPVPKKKKNVLDFLNDI